MRSTSTEIPCKHSRSATSPRVREVAISIRPERVIVDPQPDEIANTFDARVDDIVFLGDNLRLNLTVCGSAELYREDSQHSRARSGFGRRLSSSRLGNAGLPCAGSGVSDLMKSLKIGSCLLALSLVGTDAYSADSITVVNYGGSYARACADAYHERFEAATGIKVKLEDYTGGLAEVRAQVDADSIHWDVVPP